MSVFKRITDVFERSYRVLSKTRNLRDIITGIGDVIPRPIVSAPPLEGSGLADKDTKKLKPALDGLGVVELSTQSQTVASEGEHSPVPADVTVTVECVANDAVIQRPVNGISNPAVLTDVSTVQLDLDTDQSSIQGSISRTPTEENARIDPEGSMSSYSRSKSPQESNSNSVCATEFKRADATVGITKTKLMDEASENKNKLVPSRCKTSNTYCGVGNSQSYTSSKPSPSRGKGVPSSSPLMLTTGRPSALDGHLLPLRVDCIPSHLCLKC